MRIDPYNTFVYLRPDENSITKLKEHYRKLKSFGIENIQKDKEFHCTLLDYYIPFDIPSDFSTRRFYIKSDTYYHKLVKNKTGNKYSLLLCFHNYGIKKLHQELVKAYPEAKFFKNLLQHITISYGVEKIDISKIPLPDFNLNLGDFSGSEAVNLDGLEDLEWDD